MRVIELLGSVVLAAGAVGVSPIMAASALAQPADFKAAADAIVNASFPADGPGAAVVVTRGGELIYAAGRGMADVEGRRPITADTPVRLGSIVKQFTAATVLKLVEEGKVSLDDPLSRFFPDWPQPGAGATVRMLLNHASGLQDFTKIPGWIQRNRHRATTTAELVALSRELPVRAQPGHAWEYNNGGYVMLGAIIEKVTGKPWHEAMAERVLRPLGLKSIAYAAPHQAGAAAAGYTEEEGRQQPVKLSHMSVAHAAGGLHGSAADLARWAQALHHGGVLSPALYQEMIRPARMADGSTESYGFGLRQRQIRGRPALVHGGAGAGLDTDSVYIPSHDIYVAVLANSDSPPTDPDVLTRRLAALALGEPVPDFKRAAVDMAATEPLFGLYSADEGEPMRFFGRDGRLWVGQGEAQTEVFAAGGDRFFHGGGELMWMNFVRKPGGAHEVELHRVDSARPQRAVRTGPVPTAFTVAPAVLQTYVGTYQTETLAVAVALTADGRLTIAPGGQRPVTMRPVSATEFRVDGTPMRVVFHPENGAVDRLTIHRGARSLNGRRTGK